MTKNYDDFETREARVVKIPTSEYEMMNRTTPTEWVLFAEIYAIRAKKMLDNFNSHITEMKDQTPAKNSAYAGWEIVEFAKKSNNKARQHLAESIEAMQGLLEEIDWSKSDLFKQIVMDEGTGNTTIIGKPQYNLD